jgi:DMSO/TMAO reductase YedYZ molybdopterin-dependent catalytic subunit
MAERIVSRGFSGRRRRLSPGLPPGQYVTDDFPVFSAGPTPHISLDEWTFSVLGARSGDVSWSWEDFLALGGEEIKTDIHCVTRWSKLGTAWEGVRGPSARAAGRLGRSGRCASTRTPRA